MPANVHLLTHNVIGLVSIIVVLALGFFVLVKDYRKTVNITLGLTFLSVIIAIISDIIGVSVADPILSHSILMWNVSVIFICAFNFHCAMAMLDQDVKKKNLIILVYILGFLFTALFLIFPETFIGVPVPKMYFPNYYTPGSLHLVFSLVFKLLIPAYFIYELARAYRFSIDRVEKTRFLYFTLAFAMAWGFGIVPTFLTWNIPVDPMWGLIFPIVFAVPFAYAIFKYELPSIKIMTKKALFYIASVIAVGIIIEFFGLANDWLSEVYPGFPSWIMPLFSGVLIVATGVIIWQQLRESEILKYEFITTVTHKLRTPLTHIKWATENMRTSKTREETEEQLGYIEKANSKLIELTDLLSTASESDESLYKYKLERNNLSIFADSIVRSAIDHADAKKITIISEIKPEVYAAFDGSRLRFVLQTFIENAINYTGEGGTIIVTVSKAGSEAICSVKDTGIGIPRNELALISTKLYRGEKARVTDTEGMGIGLFVSKGVLNRHHGRMIVDSEGEGQGSTFSFTIPAVK